MAQPKRLGDKKYMIVYDVAPHNGKARQQKREILNGVTRQDAEAILAKRLDAVRRGTYVGDSSMTLSELFDKFMEVKKTRLEPTTLDRYANLIKTYLRPSFGMMRLASLTKAHLIEAYEAWRTRERRPSGRTIRHAHDLLRAALNWAVSLDYIERNVATKITVHDLPKAPKPVRHVLTAQELRRLLGVAANPSDRARSRVTLSAQPWFSPAVAFSSHTGARRGEVLAVRWTDLDLDEGLVTIRTSLAEPKSGLIFKRPKNDRERTVAIGPELVAILRRHRVRQAEEKLHLGPAYRENGLVFAMPDGSPVTPWNYGAAFADLVARAGVTRVRLHDLRHTHASLLAKAGVPLEVISRRLGHSTIAVTADLYLSIYKTSDVDAAVKFDAAIKVTLRVA